MPSDLTPGTNWGSEVRRQIDIADLVVGVLESDSQTPWVLFELGVASAHGKRILVISPPTTGDLPFPLIHVLVLRIGLDNKEAIDFAIKQISSAPSKPPPRHVMPTTDLATLGATTDQLLDRFNHAMVGRDYRALEDITAEAIRGSGADVAVANQPHNRGIDVAVWSDVLEPYVGNPLLIEIKSRIDPMSARRAFLQISHTLREVSGGWGLLLYGEGSTGDIGLDRDFPTILALPLRGFIEALRNRSFPEVIRDLRNQRVHGDQQINGLD